MVNQGAITKCLPTGSLPICDSRHNPRLLMPEPRLWKWVHTLYHAALSSPHRVMCFSVPQCLRWGFKGSTGQELARGSSTLEERKEPKPTAPHPHRGPHWPGLETGAQEKDRGSFATSRHRQGPIHM